VATPVVLYRTFFRNRKKYMRSLLFVVCVCLTESNRVVFLADVHWLSFHTVTNYGPRIIDSPLRREYEIDVFARRGPVSKIAFFLS
jgi:hypothetical protein